LRDLLYRILVIYVINTSCLATLYSFIFCLVRIFYTIFKNFIFYSDEDWKGETLKKMFCTIQKLPIFFQISYLLFLLHSSGLIDVHQNLLCRAGKCTFKKTDRLLNSFGIYLLEVHRWSIIHYIQVFINCIYIIYIHYSQGSWIKYFFTNSPLQ
jgi:hypothetical protein